MTIFGSHAVDPSSLFGPRGGHLWEVLAAKGYLLLVEGWQRIILPAKNQYEVICTTVAIMRTRLGQVKQSRSGNDLVASSLKVSQQQIQTLHRSEKLVPLVPPIIYNGLLSSRGLAYGSGWNIMERYNHKLSVDQNAQIAISQWAATGGFFPYFVFLY